MKNIIPLTLALPLLLIAPTSMSGCKTTQTVGEQTDDAILKTRVGRRLAADPEVRRFQIDVDVADGVVTLRGEVSDRASAEEAVIITQNTEGVTRVVDQLMVEGEEPEQGEDVEDRGDLAIKTSIGTRLAADPDVRRFQVDVDVVEGVVYLSGTVGDQASKDAAQRIAEGVDGVVEVKNELTISPEDEAAPVGEPEGEGEGEPEA